MATTDISDEQMLQMLEGLPALRRKVILQRLAESTAQAREDNLTFGEQQLRRIARERGLVWENMSEDEKERLVDDLIHEDRECRS